jgi:hypothetical protein
MTLRSRTARLALDHPGRLRKALLPIIRRTSAVKTPNEPYLNGLFNPYFSGNRKEQDAIYQLGFGDEADYGVMKFLTEENVRALMRIVQELKGMGMDPYPFKQLWYPFFRTNEDHVAEVIETGEKGDLHSYPVFRILQDSGLAGAGRSKAQKVVKAMKAVRKIHAEAQARLKKSGYKHRQPEPWWTYGT